MNRYQEGGVTLLVTAILLAGALMTTLGSYKGLFYQIKRSQNEVVARQNYWASEGGLECAFAEIHQTGGVPAIFNQCGALSLSSLSVVAGTPNTIVASKGGSTLRKNVVTPGASSSGAIKSTSGLVFESTYTSSPDPGVSLGNNEWECVALRYSTFFSAITVSTFHPWQLANKPYSTFPDSINPDYQKCADSNYSYGLTVENSKNDYLQDNTLKPFKDLFGVEKSQWFNVMSDNIFARVPRSLDNSDGSLKFDDEAALKAVGPSFNENCAQDIVSAINDNKDLIWVYGGCEIDNDEFTAISSAMDSSLGGEGIILVVQDGIFSTSGSQNFKGMLFHMTSPSATPWEFPYWSELQNHAEVNGFIASVASRITLDKKNIGYFQNGAFNPLGGFVMDGPGTIAGFRGALNFTYNRDVIEEPLKKLKKIKWQRGSWRDWN